MLASYAAAILVASLFHQPKEQAMPDDPVITISPMPPTEGQEVTINLIGGDDEATLTIRSHSDSRRHAPRLRLA